jgi:hypothetical protein
MCLFPNMNDDLQVKMSSPLVLRPNPLYQTSTNEDSGEIWRIFTTYLTTPSINPNEAATGKYWLLCYLPSLEIVFSLLNSTCWPLKDREPLGPEWPNFEYVLLDDYDICHHF